MTIIYSISPGMKPVHRKVIAANKAPYGINYKVELRDNRTCASYAWTRQKNTIGIMRYDPKVRIRNLHLRNLHHNRRLAS